MDTFSVSISSHKRTSPSSLSYIVCSLQKVIDRTDRAKMNLYNGQKHHASKDKAADRSSEISIGAALDQKFFIVERARALTSKCI